MKKMRLILLVSMGVLFLFAKLGMGQQSTVTLRWAHISSIDSAMHKACVRVAELVKEKTNGKFQIKIYPNAQLGTQRELIESVKTGMIDMTQADPGILGEYYKPLSLLACWYVIEDLDHMYKVIDGPIGKKLKEGLLKHAPIRILDAWYHGTRHLTTSRKPVFKPEDLKGLKIRTPEIKAFMEGMKAMGASVTPIPFGEVYMALQQRVVDGQENPVENIYVMKFYEVQKYMTLTRHMLIPYMQIINEQTWQNLPDEYKEVLKKAIAEGRKLANELVLKSERENVSVFKEHGMAIIDIDPELFRKRCEEIPIKLLGEDIKPLLEEIKSYAH